MNLAWEKKLIIHHKKSINIIRKFDLQQTLVPYIKINTAKRSSPLCLEMMLLMTIMNIIK